MSRPKGSKNKIYRGNSGNFADEAEGADKQVSYSPVNFKKCKKEIKRLRKLKLACRAGTKERLELEHKIKELKAQLKNITIVDKEKQPIIEAILQKDDLSEKLGIDLNKYSIEQLKIHLEHLNKRGNLNN